MLEILTRHSQRPLPTLVADAIGRWASRRERITFYAAATLIEFGSPRSETRPSAAWHEDDPKTFVPVADRFLLVESPQQIPTDRIRTSGSRDYRHPPEKCVSIEPDGVTLALDPTRSDLLIDAELARIADELPRRPIPQRGRLRPAGRRYVVSAARWRGRPSWASAPARSPTGSVRRTGDTPSPAIKLLLKRTSSSPTVLKARRMLVLSLPPPRLPMACSSTPPPATSWATARADRRGHAGRSARGAQAGRPATWDWGSTSSERTARATQAA